MDRRSRRLCGTALLGTAVLAAVLVTPAGTAQAEPTLTNSRPTVTGPAAFDTSRPLRDLAPARAATAARSPDETEDAEDALGARLAAAVDNGFSGDGAVQSTAAPGTGGTRANFEGLSNADNFNLLGIRVNPPDPNGEVGRNNY